MLTCCSLAAPLLIAQQNVAQLLRFRDFIRWILPLKGERLRSNGWVTLLLAWTRRGHQPRPTVVHALTLPCSRLCQVMLIPALQYFLGLAVVRATHTYAYTYVGVHACTSAVLPWGSLWYEPQSLDSTCHFTSLDVPWLGLAWAWLGLVWLGLA